MRTIVNDDVHKVYARSFLGGIALIPTHAGVIQNWDILRSYALERIHRDDVGLREIVEPRLDTCALVDSYFQESYRLVFEVTEKGFVEPAVIVAETLVAAVLGEYLS